MGTSKRNRRKSVIHPAATPEDAADSPVAPSTSAAGAPDLAAQPGGAEPSFSVVGVGASAGGLEAFNRLLHALPADTGMAYVLVQHLAPTHPSSLAEILSRATSMPVAEVTDEVEVEPNRVYVMPPDRNLVLVHGHLHLSQREPRGQQHPVDQFFRSLAQDQRHMAIGVVLSGTATDGTLGLEEIKAEGGITFAQDDTAQHEGMPKSAVASGCVDFVLPPEGIATEIARIASHPAVDFRPGRAADAKSGIAPVKEDLATILHIVRNATHADFTEYKVNTLFRRIRRRMVLLHKDGLEDYAQFLRTSPQEVQALYRDILINVTGFFRDPAMYEALKAKVIPALLKDRSRNDPIRVWVLGCSTGEEAYSLAMAFSEVLESTHNDAQPQIFATDLNPTGVEYARAGVYPKERLNQISRERLRRFFVEMDGTFRVVKPIRDMCVFAAHNVMSDPPFSRIDLLTCRNLLIYMDSSLQQRIIPLLHYALKPGGYLVLGASETIGRFRDVFGVEDSKSKIFVKKLGSGALPLPFLALRRPERLSNADVEKVPTERSKETGAPASRVPLSSAHLDVHKEADRLLLERFAPAAVLVSADLDILQFRGNTEHYLVPAQGKASLSLLKMARPGLLVPLRALLHRAQKEKAPVHEEGVRVRLKGGQFEVDLEVVPIQEHTSQDTCFLILFKDVAPSGEPIAKTPELKPEIVAANPEQEALETTIARLEHELASSREYLHSLIEQYDAAHEELQSANEEAQSANEELQSINEELETSKEEIQSSNEELTTVNDELNNRNREAGQLNNDLTNLISSIHVAIIIVARDLRIRRLSSVAEKLLSFSPADVGRPISDTKMNLVLPELESILTEVIDTVSPRELEVQDNQGHWWSLRMRPYLTLENKVDGAVLMLVDIDALKASVRAIAEARDYSRKWEYIVNHAGWAVATENPQTNTMELVNPAFARMHGYTVEELIGRPLADMLAPESRSQLSEHASRPNEEGDFVYESVHVRKDGTKFPVLTHVTTLKDASGLPLDRAATFQDISERRRLEDALEKRNAELAAADTSKDHFLAVLSHELRSPLNVIRLWSQILQRPGRSNDHLRKGLEFIDRSSTAQAKLIEDLADVHRISSGKLRLELSEVNLAEIICSVVDSMAPAAMEKEIRLNREIDPALALVSGDAARLQQVLANVLGNSIKFTPKGGEIWVVLRREGTRAEVIVKDTGEGISAAGLPHIFQRFRQADPLTSRAHGGLGLGLAIAKDLVELHGGVIHAESPGKGAGATFTVSLPLVARRKTTDHPTVLVGRQAEEKSSSLDGVLVLIVEDQLDAREAVRHVLEEAGAETIVVGSTDEALTAFRQHQPDVILSDIGLPGRDGYDLVRSIRALPRERGGRVPAVALTAYSTSDDRDRALSAGFQTHLAKPVEPVRLIASLVALVSQTPPRSRRGRGKKKARHPRRLS
jgi:two-component system CheB/CheR fusion protein